MCRLIPVSQLLSLAEWPLGFGWIPPVEGPVVSALSQARIAGPSEFPCAGQGVRTERSTRCQRTHVPVALRLTSPAINGLEVCPLNDKLAIVVARHHLLNLTWQAQGEHDDIQLANRAHRGR